MPPVTLLIKPVSNSCNMRCAYCFYADVSKHRVAASYGRMTPQTCETLVRKALNFSDGYCSFGFQGGEPTLAGLDFYKDIVRLQREYNYRNLRVSNSIQTNGYKLGREWAEFFAKNNFLVGLSMDGTKEAHDSHRAGPGGGGTYDAAVETAGLFAEYNVEFNILCVVNGAVASDARGVYSSLRKYKYLQFIPCIDEFGTESQPIPSELATNLSGAATNLSEPAPSSSGPASNLSESPPAPTPSSPATGAAAHSLTPSAYAGFLNAAFDCYYQDYMRGEYVSVRNFDNYVGMLLGRPPEQCGMGGACSCYFLVEADGSVFPCDFYVLDEWKIGNVNEHSFVKMLKSAAAKEFVSISEQVHPDCRKCGWHGICRGGCRRYREPATGGVLQKNKFCAAYKEFFAHSYSKMLEIAERVKRG